MKVSQTPEQVHDLIIKSKFSIPVYQRAYSWGLEEISELYYDILDSNSTGHFLGSLLLCEEDKNHSNQNTIIEKEIVDGQQRITSLFLLLFSLLKVLKSIQNKEDYIDDACKTIKDLIFIKNQKVFLKTDAKDNIPRLKTSKADEKIFKAMINSEDYELDKYRKSHKNLENAIQFFEKKLTDLKEKKGSDSVIIFLQNLLCCKFIVITAEQESDKLLLFKTINARGLELTQSDIIKNEICVYLKNNNIEEYIEEYIHDWDVIREKIERKSGNFNSFLFHYINSLEISQRLRQEKDKRIGIENWNKLNYPPVPEKLIFDIYSKLLNEQGAKKFLKELDNACNTYIKFIDPKSAKDYSNNLQKYFLSLKAMSVTKCFPLLMSASNTFQSAEFQKICKAIEALTFRHSILRKDPKELEIFYYELILKVYSEGDFSNIIDLIKQHSNFKEEGQFKAEFEVASFRDNMSKIILDRIIESMAEGVDLKTVHLEHIMPKQHKESWSDLYTNDSEKYKSYLNRLGNLTLIKDKLNIAMKNHEFKIKKGYYEKSSIKINNVLLDYDLWDYEKIDERQKMLYELAKDIWVV